MNALSRRHKRSRSTFSSHARLSSISSQYWSQLPMRSDSSVFKLARGERPPPLTAGRHSSASATVTPYSPPVATATVAGMGAWDLVINGVAAAGSIGASVVALYLARNSDRVRRREREDAAFAQARLVLVDVIDHQHSPEFWAVVSNHGREPILDVELSSALYIPNSAARCIPRRPEGGYAPVLLPGDSVKIAFTFDAPGGGSLYAGLDPTMMVKDPSELGVVVRFTDSEETYWSFSCFWDEQRLTRTAHDYQPRGVLREETERGVRSFVKRRISVDEVLQFQLRRPPEVRRRSWWRTLLRIGLRRPELPGGTRLGTQRLEGKSGGD